MDFAGANRTALAEAKVLNKLAQLDYIDCVISNTPVTFRHSARTSDVEQERLDSEAGELITAIPQKYGKPVVTIGFGNLSFTSELMKKILEGAGISSYSTPEAAVKAMHTLVKYAEIKRQFTEEPTAK